jgi:hypothetical protein
VISLSSVMLSAPLIGFIAVRDRYEHGQSAMGLELFDLQQAL